VTNVAISCDLNIFQIDLRNLAIKAVFQILMFSSQIKSVKSFKLRFKSQLWLGFAHKGLGTIKHNNPKKYFAIHTYTLLIQSNTNGYLYYYGSAEKCQTVRLQFSSNRTQLSISQRVSIMSEFHLSTTTR